MTFHPDSLPDLTGKVIIVTGGNSGIGYHTVTHLAAHGAHVYMCSRSADKGTAAIAKIKTTHPSAHISLLQADLADLGSVVAAATRFLAAETALHGLVNNAGIMATPFQLTRDGYEAQWQTNYLAHWVLTTRLLPLMLRTARALAATAPGSVRIVNVTSSGHLMAPKAGIDFDDPPSLKLKDGAGPWQRYGQSKLANILHARTLHRRHGPGSASSDSNNSGAAGEIWVSAVHPGLVDTNLAAGSAPESAGGVRFVASLARKLGLMYSADKGSWTSVFCAASPLMRPEQSGGYFEILRRLGEPWWLSRAAKDDELAERLEAWTCEAMRKGGWIP
ncbi:hypothetical protein B0T24DRAFT_530007 [Lasiosphaeria ovina]|uniref:NAD(P)-binding protein n=1 Tax=Lasiosphaeria ovina TaxID=92902 RepID=A0AAE0KDU0_9PEZI|nr:hypothetical protein B0T24DRAFT_530007 [Lasiosphaeria ovina]